METFQSVIPLLNWLLFMAMIAVNSWAIGHLFKQITKIWALMTSRAKTDEQMAKALQELNRRVHNLERKQ